MSIFTTLMPGSKPAEGSEGTTPLPDLGGPSVSTIKKTTVTLGAYVGAFALFAVIVRLAGANPFGVFGAMLQATVLNGGSVEQALLTAIPISMAALAVAVPARAGLVNVGGEGQLIMGAVAATGIGVAVGASVPGPVAWILMAVAGAAAGAAWAGISAVLRTFLDASEAVTTLLMNFVANDVMLYLIYQPWRDKLSSGQPQSAPLAHSAQLPALFGSQLNIGILVAAGLAATTWYLLRKSHWGFALRIVGGNPEAARRAGLPIKRLLITSMLVGGALAGLGGMLNLAGLELQLRPGITATFGYVAFLASWLGRHDPLKVVLAAVAFSAITLSGNGIQLGYGLDGSIVDVLLALIVVAPLALSKTRKAWS